MLKQVEAGRRVEDVCREHGISAATFYTWRSKYGGLEPNHQANGSCANESTSRRPPRGGFSDPLRRQGQTHRPVSRPNRNSAGKFVWLPRSSDAPPSHAAFPHRSQSAPGRPFPNSTDAPPTPSTPPAPAPSLSHRVPSKSASSKSHILNSPPRDRVTVTAGITHSSADRPQSAASSPASRAPTDPSAPASAR